MQLYSRSLMIFRRDLRVIDNNALNAALSQSEQVIPCFIFDPAQITPHPYQSQNALHFMLQSLTDLEQQFKVLNTQLEYFYGSPEQVVHAIAAKHRLEAVYVNRDYTPFSRRRDHSLLELCTHLNLDFHYLADTLLTEPEQTLKADGSAYQVFTAFYNKAQLFPVALASPLSLADHRFTTLELPEFTAQLPQFSVNKVSTAQRGGRTDALQILDNLDQYTQYSEQRDYPGLAQTTQLSPHLKFGTCSVREVYYAIIQQLGPDHPLIRQLYWRDFFTHIGFHFPQVFGKAFHAQYNDLEWDNNQERFDAWTSGNTGFPIVDAGMRELNATGFMHNRVRMIVASFLVKDLHISWRWGERYFAQHLVDYDPAVNNGNWQWAASTGCDAQPYFRIFNPWLQQQKFDQACTYIYRWIPELQPIPPAIIHQWDKKHRPGDYPQPIIDHSLESKRAKEHFKRCAQQPIPTSNHE